MRVWISNYNYYKVWHDITYLIPNFNGCTVEVLEFINNFIPRFIWHVITYPYPCWDSMLVKGKTPGQRVLYEIILRWIVCPRSSAEKWNVCLPCVCLTHMSGCPRTKQNTFRLPCPGLDFYFASHNQLLKQSSYLFLHLYRSLSSYVTNW